MKGYHQHEVLVAYFIEAWNRTGKFPSLRAGWRAFGARGSLATFKRAWLAAHLQLGLPPAGARASRADGPNLSDSDIEAVAARVIERLQDRAAAELVGSTLVIRIIGRERP